MGEAVGGLAQLVGAESGGDAAQGGFGVFAGAGVDALGEVVEEPADDADVFGADVAAGLGGCGGGQDRVQGCAGEGPAGRRGRARRRCGGALRCG